MAGSFVAAFAVGAIVSAAAGPAGATEVRLWILQPPGELVEFSTGELAPIRRMRLPEVAFADPTRISINGRGEVLARANGDSLWIWNGTRWWKRWRPLWRPANRNFLEPPDSSRDSRNQVWFLGGGGNSLFVLEAATVVWSGDDEADSAYKAARMEELDFDLRSRRVVFDLPYARCEDNPSQVEAYTEPCPEARVAARGGVVDDFFVLNHWEGWLVRTEGSVAQARLHQTLFIHGQTGWRADSLEVSGDTFADRGRTRIGSDVDVGCCSWSNESSNDSRVVRDNVTTVFFEEWARFHNKNYDMSFFADNISPSPDRGAVGFTIRADGLLRESAEGHADTLELRGIESALAELPVAEVDVLDPRPEILWRMPHAEFAGWLDRNRVLVVERGTLLVVDLQNGRRRDTGIQMRAVTDVIVVAR